MTELPTPSGKSVPKAGNLLLDWLAFLPALLLTVMQNLVPEIATNEPVRLTSLEQVFHPSFLSHEWLHLAGYNEDNLTFGFKILFAPIWFGAGQGMAAVIACRVVAWAILFYALSRLTRALELSRIATAAGTLYFMAHQTQGANEWIFGGIEGKCIAYAAILFALESLLAERPYRTALFLGLAYWFHVPVAMWSSLAFALAIVVSRRWSFRQVLISVSIIGAVCLPTVFAALSYIDGRKVADPTHLADWLVVVFRNPHHLDPAFFGGQHELLRLAVKFAIACVASIFLLRGYKRYFALAVPAALILEFCGGLLAWHFQALWLLKAYPFRVPDTMVVLVTSLVTAGGAVALLRQKYPTLAPRLAARVPLQLVEGAAAAIVILVLLVGQRAAVRHFETSWADQLHHKTTSEAVMEDWVKHNTPEDAIFITPPWLENFFFLAGRAEMVTFKRNPHNYLILQWYERYTALNGGAFHSIGTATVEETRKHYPVLSSAELATFHQRYGADYYLTQSPRPDLGTPVYRNPDFFLYRLP